MYAHQLFRAQTKIMLIYTYMLFIIGVTKYECIQCFYSSSPNENNVTSNFKSRKII